MQKVRQSCLRIKTVCAHELLLNASPNTGLEMGEESAELANVRKARHAQSATNVALI